MEYDIFKSQYKKVVNNCDKATVIETNGNTRSAYILYKNIIIELENVLAINVSGCNEVCREDVRNKKNNLKWLRTNIYDCIERLRTVKGVDSVGGEATLVYSLPEGCQYYIIDNISSKLVASVPGSLEMYKCCAINMDISRGFLIVSDWMAPLMPNVTPVLLTHRGALIFFDVDRNCKVAVTLPYDIRQEEYQRCIAALSTLSLIVMDDKGLSGENMESTGDVIANGLNRASHAIANGIGIGAVKLSELVNEGSKLYCRNVTPANESVHVDSNIKSGLEYARKGSHCLVEISGKAFGMLIRSTQYLASKAAPHIKSAADNVIPDDWKKTGEDGKKSTIDQLAVVAGASFNGFSQLCSSLHDGAVLFGRSFARDSSDMMKHRYGAEVGRSTEHALYSAGNLGMTAFTAMTFTKKGLIKTAAEISASELVAEYNKDKCIKIEEKMLKNNE